MRSKNVNLERSDILGRQHDPPAADVGNAHLESWRRRLGYMSTFAAAAAVIASQSADVNAADKKPVPEGVKRQAQELLKKLRSGSCSKPDLLRRQSEYRLPGQMGKFNMVEMLAGSDNCPGTPVPPGTYTTGSPFVDSGNTTGGNDTVTSIPQACNGYYDDTRGPDHIYSFTLTARGANPQIRVTTTSPTYDLSIYILNGAVAPMCPAGTGNIGTNCIAGADDTFFPQPETIGAAEMNTLPLNVPLYFFVDSYYNQPGGNGGTGNGPYTVTMQDITVGGGPQLPENDAPVDMNGDGKSDFVVLRAASGAPDAQVTWLTSYQDGFPTNPTDWGVASDFFVPADFDGDGKDDFAVWRPGTNGIFYIVRSSNNTLFTETFGTTGDNPYVVGDYNGDDRDDLAVYRAGATPADQSTWFWRSIGSPPGVQAVPWGQGGDTPAPGDYDGDNRYDFVVQRADSNNVNGRFWVKESDGLIYSQWFGLKDDLIVPGDYDGDGKTDFAVVRNDNGQWRWDYEPSGTAGITTVTDTWGVAATDIIAQGDYNGDGETEYAVWRPGSPGTFFMMTTVDRVITSRPWGQTGDVPAASYNTHE